MREIYTEAKLINYGDSDYSNEANGTLLVANLKGKVELEGRPQPPHPSWITSLTVTLHESRGTEPVATYEVQTSNEGKFEITNLKSSFGKKKGEEGFNDNCDFNRDGIVDITDFSMLRKNFGKKGDVVVMP